MAHSQRPIAPVADNGLLDQSQLRVSLVIPARNEARNLPHVLACLPRGLFEVILVDGQSIDDTVAVARRQLPTIRVVHQAGSGKGNALACGFAVNIQVPGLGVAVGDHGYALAAGGVSPGS